MQWPPELLFAAAIAAVAFLAGWVYVRSRTRRTRSVGRRLTSGPANLRFTCAGCSGQFTHSRRTLAAWERGGRSFYCNACHTKWQSANPGVPERGGARVPGGGRRSGCFGVAVLLLAIPVGVAIAVRLYA